VNLLVGGCFTSLICNNMLCTQTPGIVINTLPIFYKCKLSYCNSLRLFFAPTMCVMSA
jgi:hypothetical protein